jgi:hypothetical protein
MYVNWNRFTAIETCLVVCNAQIFVFDRLVEEDGVRGDENGPFDKLTVKERRQELADQKVRTCPFALACAQVVMLDDV